MKIPKKLGNDIRVTIGSEPGDKTTAIIVLVPAAFVAEMKRRAALAN